MTEIKKIEETLEEAEARADRAERELKQLRRDNSALEPKAQAPTDESLLRNDAMMSHLMDALNEGSDIGHYGRLVFAMVASKFLPEDEVVAWLRKDNDFSEQQATAMIKQVESRDYNPPRRERILEWQSEQEFPIIPNTHDPDCGNVYKSLKFPKAVYSDIENYQEDKVEAQRE
jgi:hypothetical protein